MHNDPSNTIRIVLIDDQSVIRAGLRMLLESWPGLQVVGEAGTPSDALCLAETPTADILLYDPSPNGNGHSLDHIPQLLSASENGRLIVLTGAADSDLRLNAVRLGAMGVVLKERAVDDLRKAIEKVNTGEVWLDRNLTATLIAEFSRKKEQKPDPDSVKIASLTNREREIASLVCAGLKNKEIGERLFISDTTVRHHLTSIMGKLEVTNRLELVIYLYRNKFASPPS